MKFHHAKRGLSVLLVLCMLLTALPSGTILAAGNPVHGTQTDPSRISDASMNLAAGAEGLEPEEAPYGPTDLVRVFIVLDGKPTVERGDSTVSIASNHSAMAYAAQLEAQQARVAKQISREILHGAPLDVRWNLTLAANAISANVPYGEMEAISKIDGVQAVHLVPVYELDQEVDPNTISSGNMVGSYTAWLDGYTGAGSRIAVIDTGIDADHPSFRSDAFEYGLLVAATKNGKSVEEYGLLDVEEIGEVLPLLNASKAYDGLTAGRLHHSSKIAYGFNYIDENLDITHDHDTQGDHGTHVSGIATANRYVAKNGASGVTYSYADNGVVGTAPDAQLLTMKVFGAGGGAYADDYIAAIEDAILLNCDAINLSLGSAAVGFTSAGNEYMDGVLASLSKTDTVVCMSCGNSGYWSEHTNTPLGLLYTEDSNTGRVGSPGAYPNSLAVASADNIGATGGYVCVGEEKYVYNDTASVAFGTLDTSEKGSGTAYDYLFLGDPTDPEDTVKYGGSAEDFTVLDVAGKIVLISRGGGVNFADKQKYAMNAGAAGAIIYNNEAGTINMSLSGKLPCVSMRKDQMESILAQSVQDAAGSYTGSMVVASGVATDLEATGGVITMSSFSSWGVPGNLTLKPEITAPGGSIYSTRDGGQYGLMSGTSMASPSAAGMAAVVAQYIHENHLDQQEGLTVRTLAQSLLMGTAIPTMDPNGEVEYAPRSQGAGLANVARAVSSPTYLLVDGQPDGKVKAEFGDDPARTGVYEVSFQVHNLSDRPASYQLDASVLAPGLVEQEGETYVSMSDVTLDASVTFSGNTTYDLNGDGSIDQKDVLAILRHVTGAEGLTGKALAAADLDGSGAVEAVDAQILEDLLEGKTYGERTLADLLDQSLITVPAHDSVQVHASIRLTDAGRAYLEEHFVNGTYVEGYLYLHPLADAEGAQGVEQSIPFLAFYGNWTDSSMLDRQRYAEHYYDREAHVPYIQRSLMNYFTVKLQGVSGSFYYGLNRYAQDQSYLADRGALSSDRGDAIQALNYTLIRNAASVTLTIANQDTGEVYYSSDYGSQYGAFYYTNAGMWANVNTSKTIGWAGKDGEGKPLPNNTKVAMTLTMAPEYNVAADGTISGLGKGATWSVPVTIDNEAPTVHQLYFSSDALTGSKLLNFDVQDNQYIAAIQIFNEAGNQALARISPNQTEANARVTGSVDVSEIHEDTVLVAVVDYAGNVSAYDREVGNGGGEDPGDATRGVFAFLPASQAGIIWDQKTTETPIVMMETELTFTAAEQVNGYVFATDSEGYFYVLKHGKFDPQVICKIGYTIQDLAYNPVDGKLYGLTATGSEENFHYGAIVALDMYTGQVQLMGYMEDLEDGDPLQVLACNEDGVFYGITASKKNSKLYRFTIDEKGSISEPVLVGATGYKANYLQTMAFDHDTGKLYWAQFYQESFLSPRVKNLLEVNTQTGEATVMGALSNETTAMYIVSSGGAGFGKTDQVSSVELVQDTLSLYSGGSAMLEGYVTPWNLADRSILWSSSNPEVATVTSTGEVTGIQEGTAVITAAAKADPTVTATCTVTVKALNTKLRGIVHDGNGDGFFSSIDADTAEFQKIAKTPEDFISAATVDGQLYAATQGALYQVNPEDGYRAAKLCNTAVPFTDMAHSPALDVTLATYGYYLLVVDPEAEGGYLGAWNLSNMFNAIAGITYAGHDSTYSYFYLLASSGSLYMIGVKPSGTVYELSLLKILSTDSKYAISGQHMNQSLYYDGNTGWIYWARYDGESSSSLVAIHEETGEVVARGTFADDAWPVVGLYSAEPAQDQNRTGDFLWNPAMQVAQTDIAFESMTMSPNGSVAGLDR